jgi:hypothetical protein
MPKEVRVNDNVNYILANGQATTARITAVTTQNDVALEYFNPQKVVVASSVRSAAIPRVAGTFYKEA